MFVYLIQCGKNGPIKIGKSSDIEKRMADLQTANPQELRIIGKVICKGEKHALEVEKNLHLIFHKKRIRGEWFHKNINLAKIDNYQQIIDIRNVIDTKISIDTGDIGFVFRIIRKNSFIGVKGIRKKTRLTKKKAALSIKYLLSEKMISINHEGEYYSCKKNQETP